jgi:hypothetical protein
MEDNLNSLEKWDTTQLKTIETNFNLLGKWETTSILWQNGKQPHFFAKWKRKRPQFSGKYKET